MVTMGNRAVRIADIAREAKVSASTISKVLNGRPGVSQSTRDAVESLLAASGYRKPLVATKTSSTMELVVTEVANNGTMEMIRETAGYARQRGIGMTITCTGRVGGGEGRKGVDECLRGVIDRNPLGVVLLLSDITAQEESLLSSRAIPYVIVDPVGQVSADALGVGIDNWTSGLNATEYLLSLGHTRIGVITGPQQAQSSQARLSGYMAALQRRGIEVDWELIAVGDYLPDRAFAAACTLLDLPKRKRPTAIFAFNDLSAVSVYRAARQRGIDLPERLSVIGFDDVYPAAYLHPALTTVTQPFALIARRAMDLILDARAGQCVQRYHILPTQLKVRDSCAAPWRPAE